jgi:probable FeS assembly SUF system protein SufT
MNMSTTELLELKRDCDIIEIPSGMHGRLAKGSKVRITQSSGSSYTILTEFHALCRIDAKDADALGIEVPTTTQSQKSEGVLEEQLVWDVLKTVYDPEIPVNIVDLGLIYSCTIAPLEQGGKKIEIKMSMTAPGCGMGNVIKSDVEYRLSQLPEVKETNVEVVMDPPWNPGRMSEAAKLQLGFDLDYGSSAGLPMMR